MTVTAIRRPLNPLPADTGETLDPGLGNGLTSGPASAPSSVPVTPSPAPVAPSTQIPKAPTQPPADVAPSIPAQGVTAITQLPDGAGGVVSVPPTPLAPPSVVPSTDTAPWLPAGGTIGVGPVASAPLPSSGVSAGQGRSEPGTAVVPTTDPLPWEMMPTDALAPQPTTAEATTGQGITEAGPSVAPLSLPPTTGAPTQPIVPPTIGDPIDPGLMAPDAPLPPAATDLPPWMAPVDDRAVGGVTAGQGRTEAGPAAIPLNLPVETGVPVQPTATALPPSDLRAALPPWMTPPNPNGPDATTGQGLHEQGPGTTGPVAGAGSNTPGAPGSTFTAENNLIGSQVLPGGDPRLLKLQGLSDDQLAKQLNGPDRLALAKQYMAADASDADTQYQHDLTDATDQAAAHGRLGSGQLTNRYGDLFAGLTKAKEASRQRYLTGAAEGTIGDTRANTAAAAGAAQNAYGEGAAGRNEARTERNYQSNEAQQAIVNRLTQMQAEQGWTQQEFENALKLYGVGNANDPAGAYERAAGQATNEATGNANSVADLMKLIAARGGG